MNQRGKICNFFFKEKDVKAKGPSCRASSRSQIFCVTSHVHTCSLLPMTLVQPSHRPLWFSSGCLCHLEPPHSPLRLLSSGRRLCLSSFPAGSFQRPGVNQSTPSSAKVLCARMPSPGASQVHALPVSSRRAMFYFSIARIHKRSPSSHCGLHCAPPKEEGFGLLPSPTQA